MKKSAHNDNRGYILLPVVLMLSLLAAIAFLVNRQNGISLQMTANEAEVDQALAVAGAGLEHAKWLVQDNVCDGDLILGATALGDHSYTVTVDAAATTTNHYTLQPDRDAAIQETAPDQNFGNSTAMEVKTQAGDSRRALYYFVLSTIPAQTRVTSATLWLHVIDNDSLGTINLHPVNDTWIENWVTWNNIAASYDDQVLGRISPQLSGNSWVAINLTAMTQFWVNNPSANHGMMLIAALEDSLESTYTSDDSGSLCPYLEISTAVGATSPVTITASATLDSGVIRTLSRAAYKAYQRSTTFTLQPDAAVGKDAYVSIFWSSGNYGASDDLWVQDWDNDVDEVHYKSLLWFDISPIPIGSRVLSAVLSLYQNTHSTNGGLVEVHRVTSDWVEGDQNGSSGAGATWDDRDTGLPWNTNGGDYDLIPIASTQLPAGIKDWFDWDITELVNGWINGAYDNNGLILLPGAYGTAVCFNSSDEGKKDNPLLTVTYACECGDAGVAPKGSGRVLLVVDRPYNLTANEVIKKSLFEAWGYTVTLINDDDDFEDELAANDVVYVSESVNSSDIDTKLTNATIGVVNEEGWLNDELGIESDNSSNWPVGDSLEITDNSHYITAIFPIGVLPIYRADMQGLAVGSTPAPDLQTFANWSSGPTIATLDAGAAKAGGGTAAGRRVMLPIGRDGSVHWRYINNNGLLIVQRALQWAAGGELSFDPGLIAHWKLDDGSGTTAADSVGGHDGTLAGDPNWVAGAFEGALDFDGNGDYVDVGHVLAGGAQQISVTAWIFKRDSGDDRVICKSSGTTIVDHIFSLGVADTTIRVRLGTTDNGGTDNYDGGLISLNAWVHLAFTYDGAMLRIYKNGTETASYAVTGDMIASTLAVAIGNVNATDDSYWNGLLDDVRIYDRVMTAGEVVALTVGTFRDEFNNQSYGNNDGSLSWAAGWVEGGETTNPIDGDLQVVADISNYQLRLRDNGRNVMREANLSAFTFATLSFEYRRDSLDKTGEFYDIQVSGDGGTTWHYLDHFAGPATDGAYTLVSYDVSAYCASNTQIRFISSTANMSDGDLVWIDNVEISCSP
jgi:hypothetical protein